MFPLSLFIFTHVKSGGPALETRRPQGRNHAFSRVFVCVSECGAIQQCPLLHSERDDAVPCDLCRIYLHVDITADG
jgi:hypothetical protein